MKAEKNWCYVYKIIKKTLYLKGPAVEVPCQLLGQYEEEAMDTTEEIPDKHIEPMEVDGSEVICPL